MTIEDFFHPFPKIAAQHWQLGSFLTTDWEKASVVILDLISLSNDAEDVPSLSGLPLWKLAAPLMYRKYF